LPRGFHYSAGSDPGVAFCQESDTPRRASRDGRARVGSGIQWFEHYHEHQDELYFVHAGKAGFEVDGERFELGPGGLVHVESTTPRRFWNAGDGDLVLLLVGGKDGYVERDGKMVDPADEDRRRAFSAGDLGAIRARPS